MSATLTMTTTATTPPLPATLSLSTEPPSPPPSASHCCPGCGLVLPPPLEPTTKELARSADRDSAYIQEAAASLLEAQARIADLEAQVRLLNQKATAAVDRWADYEDELANLRKQVNAQPQPKQSPPQQPLPSPSRSSFLPTTGVANRLSAMLSRKSTPNLRPSSIPSTPTLTRTPAPEEEGFGDDGPAHPLNAHADLLSALHHEQHLRRAAESRLSTTDQEVEELSVSLFEQANEMVATERRARARLEERVETLEKREADKKRRLDRLEGAVGRIERVRSLLGEERLKKMREQSRVENDMGGRTTPPQDDEEANVLVEQSDTRD
ncbi:hypothetical protein HYQ44_004851 [Verticillium longisporum]|nr:hypothetical protein HYQ44_004851 [Verticillium longisporum]